MKLFKHQEEALEELKGKKRYALLMEQGTGKTLVAIKRLEKLVKAKKVKNIIIVALSAGVPNWEAELKRFLEAPRSFNIIEYKGTAPARKKLLEAAKASNKTNIIILNYEKIRLDKKELIKFKPDLLILDESQKVKNRNAQVTKATKLISNKCEYVYLLTGTPMSVGYEDIFGQFLIMNETILGTRWKDFENRYLELGGFQGKQIIGYKNVRELKKKIRANSYSVKKKDCLDLPPVTIQNLYCELGPKAKAAYKKLDKELMAEFEGQEINITEALINRSNNIKDKKDLLVLDSALIKSMKLQQITGGFIKNEEQVLLIDKSKINLLKETVEASSHPVIIFCKYRAEIIAIKEELKSLKVEELSGKTKDKGQVVQDFQQGKYDVLVIQTKTGSASINLTAASTAIFYSWSASYIDMAQAMARLDRIGQVNPVNIYFLVSKGTVDEISLKLLKQRENLINKI